MRRCPTVCTVPATRRKKLYQFDGVQIDPDDSSGLTLQPWKIELENGTKCIIRLGGAWGSGADGRVGTYHCEGAKTVVLTRPGDAFNAGIKTESDIMYAQVGVLGNADEQLPEPTLVPICVAHYAAYHWT